MPIKAIVPAEVAHQHRRVWSLLEVMNLFRAQQLGALCSQFHILLSTVDAGITIFKDGLQKPDEVHTKMADGLLETTGQICRELGLLETDQQLNLVKHYLGNTGRLTMIEFHTEMRRLVETLIVEAGKR